MKTVKKVDAWSVAKMSLILNALFGAILGVIVMLMSVFVPTETEQEIPWFFSLGAPLALPVIYGIMGLVGGYVMALLYNVAAKWVGGIKVELQD